MFLVSCAVLWQKTCPVLHSVVQTIQGTRDIKGNSVGKKILESWEPRFWTKIVLILLCCFDQVFSSCEQREAGEEGRLYTLEPESPGP